MSLVTGKGPQQICTHLYNMFAVSWFDLIGYTNHIGQLKFLTHYFGLSFFFMCEGVLTYIPHI